MRRAVVVRWASTLVAIALILLGASLLLPWADEPLTRQAVLFEAPLHLVGGTRVRGTFTPVRDGPNELRIRVRRDRPLDELRALLGGHSPGADHPPGLEVSTVVRDSGGEVHRGTWAGHEGGTLSPDYLTTSLATVPDGHPEAYEVEVSVDRAQPGLDALDARFEIGPAGDWIHYAPLIAAERGALVVLGSLLAVVLVIVVHIVSWRRSRRPA